MLDRTDEALFAARNACPRLLHEGDHHRMLLPLALIDALHGRLDVAARVVGFDDAVRARTHENVSIVAPLLHARLDPLLAEGLSADERKSDRRKKELHLTTAGAERLRVAQRKRREAQARFEAVFGGARASRLRRELRAVAASELGGPRLVT